MNFKICGLTRAEDAVLAASLGAWALGFIFYPKSPRAVVGVTVKNILEQVSRHSSGNPAPLTVGVFVTPKLSEIKSILEIVPLTALQLYDVSLEFRLSLREAFASTHPNLKIIQALRTGEASIGEGDASVDYQLVDSEIIAGGERIMGGTGIPVDWAKASKIRGKPLILAGGLKPENIALAVKTVAPFAVDVSSGIEVSPGVKSESRLREFFAAIPE